MRGPCLEDLVVRVMVRGAVAGRPPNVAIPRKHALPCPLKPEDGFKEARRKACGQTWGSMSM